MGFQKPKSARPHEPSGFTLRSSGRASERARQQGWQTGEQERTRLPEGKQPGDGGTDYDYGARDFGDLPKDTSGARLKTGSSLRETFKLKARPAPKKAA